MGLVEFRIAETTHGVEVLQSSLYGPLCSHVVQKIHLVLEKRTCFYFHHSQKMFHFVQAFQGHPHSVQSSPLCLDQLLNRRKTLLHLLSKIRILQLKNQKVFPLTSSIELAILDDQLFKCVSQLQRLVRRTAGCSLFKRKPVVFSGSGLSHINSKTDLPQVFLFKKNSVESEVSRSEVW